MVGYGEGCREHAQCISDDGKDIQVAWRQRQEKQFCFAHSTLFYHALLEIKIIMLFKFISARLNPWPYISMPLISALKKNYPPYFFIGCQFFKLEDIEDA